MLKSNRSLIFLVRLKIPRYTTRLEATRRQADDRASLATDKGYDGKEVRKKLCDDHVQISIKIKSHDPPHIRDPC